MGCVPLQNSFSVLSNFVMCSFTWLTNEFVFSILVRYFTNAKFALQVPTQYSKFGNVVANIQNKLGNRAVNVN